jgi:outer membrane lipoprotein SlyB
MAYSDPIDIAEPIEFSTGCAENETFSTSVYSAGQAPAATVADR